MKKNVLIIVLVLAALVISTTVVLADQPIKTDAEGNETAWKASTCTKIQSGTILAKDLSVITTGYDKFGYNYQAHQFVGYYGNASRPPVLVDSGTWLMMKWNDAWLSNVDCDGDWKLDRHYGFDSYIGSGAWTTNHMRGEYEQDGQICKWEYFVKIVAVPADATLTGGIWYAFDGTEIGQDIWGQFAIIQEVYNDPCGGSHGIWYLSPDHSGLGNW